MKWFAILLLFTTHAFAQPPSAQRKQELQNMFRHDCGSCHGLTAQGGLGPSLLAQALENKSDELLVQTILEGRQGTAMPPWKPFLSESEALWMVQKLMRQQAVK